MTLAWKNPGSKYRFSLYRDTPGTKREFFHKQTGTGYVDTSLIDPQTSYTYSLQVWEVNANVGIWPASARTPNLAAPSWTLTTRGLKLVFTVTMPIGVSSGDVEWSTNSNFAGAVRRSMTRDVLLSGSAGSAVYESSSLTNVLYYARVRLRKNAVIGKWSTSKSVTPKGYLAPYGPRSVNATSPAVGQVRLRWSWGGDYRGETGIIERKKKHTSGRADSYGGRGHDVREGIRRCPRPRHEGGQGRDSPEGPAVRGDMELLCGCHKRVRQGLFQRR